MSSKIKNIIIFVVIFIIAVVAYNFFFKKDKVTAPLVTTTGVPRAVTTLGQQIIVGQELLNTLLSLRNIKLDNSLFESKEFKSLLDFKSPIPSEGPVGRPNPFAPLALTGGITTPVITGLPTNITSASVTLNGIVDAGSPSLIQAQKQFAWGETQLLENRTEPITQTTSSGNFSQEITGLTSGRVYYFRAEVLTSSGPLPGQTLTFITTTE